VKVPAADLGLIEWDGRTVKRHRAEIRRFFGFRQFTVADGEKLTDWLAGDYAQRVRQRELVREQFLSECRTRQVEPPTPAAPTQNPVSADCGHQNGTSSRGKPSPTPRRFLSRRVNTRRAVGPDIWCISPITGVRQFRGTAALIALRAPRLSVQVRRPRHVGKALTLASRRPRVRLASGEVRPRAGVGARPAVGGVPGQE